MTMETTGGRSNLFSEKVREELTHLTESINLMMDNLHRIERPIEESRKNLPKANEQLDKISAQTEAAAHQMLDRVEQIIDREETVVQLTDELLAGTEEMRPTAVKEKIQKIKDLSAESQNNAFLIMDALQFQDITAQQMSHASALLEDIESRLQHLLSVFDGEAIQEEGTPTKSRRAYDPNADFCDGKAQKDVDSIVSEAIRNK